MRKLSTIADQLRETLRTFTYLERVQHINHHTQIAETPEHKAYLQRLKNAPLRRQDKVRVVANAYIAVCPLGSNADINADLEAIWARYVELAGRLRSVGYDARNTGHGQIHITTRADVPILGVLTLKP